EIIEALRRGTVPPRSLDAFAVGVHRFEEALDGELEQVRSGQGIFKAVRGDYGSGKTFFGRWLQERARQKGFAVSEIQISETETPLHRLETVYRRLVERLSTSDVPSGALRSIIDSWFYTLEEDVLAEGTVAPDDAQGLLERTNVLLEQRLAEVSREAPSFAAALRGYRTAMAAGDRPKADGLLAWVGGQPNVSASVKRDAGIKGEVDHFGALSFLQGILTLLRDSGRPGLLVVLDEVETLQRVRSDAREKSLNALRALIDELSQGRFRGMYLLITGTPAFYDGSQGAQRLPPLAQRLSVTFPSDPKFDNPRAVQIRLPAFTLDSLVEVGLKIRNIYAEGSKAPERIRAKADDAYVRLLVQKLAGDLGGKTGVVPRIFLKKLVGEVLDVIDQYPEFDPRRDYALTVHDSELDDHERAARDGRDVDDIELPTPPP
ncbi:MAG: BREX system ATP-binding protein BrxD, partial [Planctomycetota bacterium]|nr:BREX system ATP-binding protein BrxD [Planctomycetota bacterium]